MVDVIPANTSTLATIVVNGFAYNTIETVGDVDWFKVTLAAGRYHINLGGDPLFGSALSDTLLRVYNSAGVELRLDDDNGAGVSSYLDFTATSSGTYYIAAAAWASGTGDYVLSFMKDDIPLANFPQTQKSFEEGSSVTGLIDVSDEGDTFSAYLRADVIYTFTLEGQAGGNNVRSDPLTALVGKGMTIYDPMANEVGSGAQATATSVVLSIRAYYTGIYTINVGGIGNSHGYFSLSETASSTAINHRPAGTDATLTVTEDAYASFTSASFGFTDTDGHPFSMIIIAGLPGNGSLTLSGVPVNVGQSIYANNLGNLHWTPQANSNGNGLASFTFEVVDAPLSLRGATDQTPNTMTFNVTPVNDAPVIVSGGGTAAAQVDINENRVAVTTIQANDVDNTLTYSVSGIDASLFNIDAATGVLTFKTASDFEAPHDAGLNNIYNLTVLATDGSLTDTQDLTVVVHNVAGNIIAGTKGNNTVDATRTIGGKGATSEEDHINGKKGDDKLSGLGGNDTLIGGAGKDTLTGGAGFDRLDGGKDADRFVFSAKLDIAGVDTIVSFTHNEDKLALDDKIFKAVGSSLSTDEFYAKAGATQAHDKSDHLVYNKATGDLYYDKDGKGGAAAVHFATISNHPGSLDHGDFVIV